MGWTMLWLLASMWFALAGLFHLFSIVLTQCAGGSVGLRERLYLLGGHPKIKPIRADFEQSDKGLPGERCSCRCRTACRTNFRAWFWALRRDLSAAPRAPLLPKCTTREWRRRCGPGLPTVSFGSAFGQPVTYIEVDVVIPSCLRIWARVIWVINGCRNFDVIIMHCQLGIITRQWRKSQMR